MCMNLDRISYPSAVQPVMITERIVMVGNSETQKQPPQLSLTLVITCDLTVSAIYP